MTAASGFYGLILENALDASALDPNLDGDTITCALVTDTYTPNFNSHDEFADITNEISGTGYSTPGANLGSQTWAISSGLLPFDAADRDWTTASFTARAAIVFDNTLSGDPLLSSTTFGADYTVTAGTFTIQWAAGGIFSFDIVP